MNKNRKETKVVRRAKGPLCCIGFIDQEKTYDHDPRKALCNKKVSENYVGAVSSMYRKAKTKTFI